MKLLYIKISFHRSECYCLESIDDKIEPNYALGIRIYWSYFVKQQLSIGWEEFVNFLLRFFEGTDTQINIYLY